MTGYKPRRALPVDDLALLRDLAENATLGPWTLSRAGIVDNDGEEIGEAERLGDASYIVAASPNVIIALIDRLEAAEAKIETVESLHRLSRKPGEPHCVQCYQPWPCSTISELEEEL